MANSQGRNMSEHQLTNKSSRKQVGVKFYIFNIVARKMYSIKSINRSFLRLKWATCCGEPGKFFNLHKSQILKVGPVQRIAALYYTFMEEYLHRIMLLESNIRFENKLQDTFTPQKGLL
jgi:hypothetical protein